jgi:multiple sugar transport system substrate-binding protein
MKILGSPHTRRKLLERSLSGAAALATTGFALAQGAKKFQGTTLNVSCWSAPYPLWLAEFIPEFEQQTGIKINYDTPGFAVFNQRADLELSTKGSAYDVLNITLIYTSRWIGAGWFTPLDEFIKNPEKTPSDWDAGDFFEGSTQPLRDRAGALYGVPWTTEAIIAAASRFDLFKQAGIEMPDTFDELELALMKINKKDDVAAFVNENQHGWSWIPYLQGFGGRVFRGPPDDLMPMLDSPEAIISAEWYSNLLKSYAPDGVLSYTYDQSLNSLKAGRSNYTTDNLSFVLQLGDEATSKVSKTVAYSMIPRGPKGRFPQLASHGWGVPVGSKNKDAAWEFIKWATSKEMFQRMLTKKGYVGVTRPSIVNGPEYRKSAMINGYDLGDIYLKTLDLAKQGHMIYRTVSVFPQVNQVINQAISKIVSGQATVKEALVQAQQTALLDLRRSGVKL